jgi:hypothetical protein
VVQVAYVEQLVADALGGMGRDPLRAAASAKPCHPAEDQ